MAGKKKFINKAQSVTFQVVHRSQRDPALANSEASQLVLKPVAQSYNLLKKGKVSAGIPQAEYEFDEIEDSDLDEYFNDDDDSNRSDRHGDSDSDNQENETVVVDFAKERQDAAATAHAVAVAALANGPSLSESTEGAAASRKETATLSDERDVSLFGIFFKDQNQYDYSQHLKNIGEDPYAVYVEAKTRVVETTKKADVKAKGIQFLESDARSSMTEVPRRKVAFNIPTEVLPSEQEEDVGMLARVDTSVLQVEPSMRETIYALDDEEYIEDDIDDFFEALNSEEVPDELKAKLDPEDYFPEKDKNSDEDDDGDNDWYEEYQRYKNGGKDSDNDYEDEENDELGSLMERKTALTNLSMTSSAMMRTKLLTNLDDQFDETLKHYDDDQLGDLEGATYDPDTLEPVPLDATQPSLSTKRMNQIFDTFLESTEVVGRKGLVLNKVPELNKIDSIRKDLGEVTRVTEAMKLSVDDTIEGGDVLDAILEREILEMRPHANEHKWDVETVLTTYSNIYNHPKMIKDVMMSTRKIRLGRKGPRVMENEEKEEKATTSAGADEDVEENALDFDGEGEFEDSNNGKARSKNETKEEKKARKQAVKEQKKDRREVKKATKDAFKKEAQVQHKSLLNKNVQDLFVPI